MATLLLKSECPSVGVQPRSVLLVSEDADLRSRLRTAFANLSWNVRAVGSAALAWVEAEEQQPETIVLDTWLPDLDVHEFIRDFRDAFPGTEITVTDGSILPNSSRRCEILHALREADRELPHTRNADWHETIEISSAKRPTQAVKTSLHTTHTLTWPDSSNADVPHFAQECERVDRSAVDDLLPELIGYSPSMLEVSRRIRLVAPRSTPVLVEGPTGSGKELVTRAIHRLSSRNQKPLVVINCAAIPDALLEAELFGHARGAFTGAVQRRIGRVEAADGGTLFLDEIAELPFGLQGKLLRFLERGEIQRIGENRLVNVDVRVIAATHQSLARAAEEGKFRSDLYYRLAVFLIRTPSLARRMDDLPVLIDHLLQKIGISEGLERIEKSALTKLAKYSWPGNVRELEHVLERAVILAGTSKMVTADDIDFGYEVE